jgi:preflagellin peptidase FlaK
MNTFELLNTIDIIRLVPILIIFAYAAYSDYKTGEVTNKAWLYTPIGTATVIIEYAVYAPNILLPAITTMIVCVAIAYGLYAVKHGWGGADAKALMALAMCYPLAPAYLAWLPLFPMLAFGAGSIIATIVMLIKGKKQIRYLPYICIGLYIIALL